MDVFLMIRRHKTTIFTDAKENTSVNELKRMIEGILKINPVDQILFSYDNDPMENDKVLQDYGITMSTAKAQAPAQLGLVLRFYHTDFWVFPFSFELVNEIAKVINQRGFSIRNGMHLLQAMKRNESGEFEQLEITTYSSPPDLPEVMKTQEASNGQEQVA